MATVMLILPGLAMATFAVGIIVYVTNSLM